jgi:hypothetical protein
VRKGPGGPRYPATTTAARRPGRSTSAQHVRHLRRRREQPDGPRRGAGRGPGARPGLQPPLHLRRHRPRQDPPDARHRARHPAQQPGRAGGLPLDREVHQRLHPGPAGERDGEVPPALPPRRRHAARRRPVPRRQGAHPGGVLPHLQRPVRVRQADRPVQRPAGQRDPEARGPPGLPVRMGPARRHPGAGLRDPDRHPPHQGRQPEMRCCPSRSSPSSPRTSPEHPPAGGGADQGGQLQRPQQQAARPRHDGAAPPRHAGGAGAERS